MAGPVGLLGPADLVGRGALLDQAGRQDRLRLLGRQALRDPVGPVALVTPADQSCLSRHAEAPPGLPRARICFRDDA